MFVIPDPKATDASDVHRQNVWSAIVLSPVNAERSTLVSAGQSRKAESQSEVTELRSVMETRFVHPQKAPSPMAPTLEDASSETLVRPPQDYYLVEG